MAEVYSSVEQLKTYTGVEPKDLYFTTKDGYPDPAAALDAELTTYLLEAKDLIDVNRNRDYTAEVVAGTREQVPPGIHLIARRIAANIIAQAKVRRTTDKLTLDEFKETLVPDRVFTKSIREDLEQYPYKQDSAKKSGFSMFRVRSQDEIDGDDLYPVGSTS